MRGRAGRRVGRRTGPPGEDRWWDPADQAALEEPLLGKYDVPIGWRMVPMLNNAERFDPWMDVAPASAFVAARDARRLTALDEGQAWRDDEGRLVVLRAEAYADPDDGAHRRAWQDGAVGCLEAQWRARWAERGERGGWIEARHHGGSVRAARRVDWFQVEDHTAASRGGDVAIYEHLTAWGPRSVVVMTFRTVPQDELDETAAAMSRRLLANLDDRFG